MLQIEELYPLKSLNTFGIDVKADFFVALKNNDEVKKFVHNHEYKKLPFLVLGGGSNLLFTSDYKGIIIKPEIEGIEIISDNSSHCEVRCGAGVIWDDFVAWVVGNNLYGIENLSLIPGTVGASPIQNIGAYGIEVKDSLISVEGFRIDTGEHFKLNNFECEFGYRSSIFKSKQWKQIIITQVNFRFAKNPEFKIEYGTVKTEVEKLGELNLKNVRQAIIGIRQQKLPNPAEIGNAGSFFKNPLISSSQAKKIKEKYDDVHLFKNHGDLYKIPAAFLIEKCGWKGFREGDAGVYKNQPLILTNYGNAKGIDILNLAYKISDSVRNAFGLDLEMEVNIVA